MAELISVVIPARNAERFIAQAIQSVGVAAVEAPHPVELIVVVDYATDETVSTANTACGGLAIHARVLRGDGRGASSARNIGVSKSTGTLLAFLDADDLFTPYAISAQVFTLQQNNGRITFGGVVQFRDAGPNIAAPADSGGTFVQYGPVPGAMMIQRALFDEVGPFVVSEPLAEWVHWYGRLCDSGASILRTNTATLRRRLHNSNLSASQGDGMLGYVRGFKTLLDERRSSAQIPAPL